MITDNDIKVELATSEELYKAVKAVRKQVFVKEQGIPEDKEFDGNDFCSAHVVAYIQKRHRKLPIGTMRIRFFSDFAKFERMAVTRNFRKTNVSENIMQYGFDYVAQKGYRHDEGFDKNLVEAKLLYDKADTAVKQLKEKNIGIDYNADKQKLIEALNNALEELKQKVEILNHDPDPIVVEEAKVISERIKVIENAISH